jgi:outer membrane protein
MNRSILLVLLAALCVPVFCMAQGTAQAPAAPQAAPEQPVVIVPAKVAWLYLDELVFTCDEGKREFTEVQKYVDNKNSENDNMRKEYEDLKKNLSVQSSKLTDEARADFEEQIEVRETALQRFQQDTQKEIEKRRVRITNYIGKRMLPVIDKYAKEKGLSAIFYYNPSRDAWVNPAMVITKEIVKVYNQAYPIDGSSAAKP